MKSLVPRMKAIPHPLMLHACISVLYKNRQKHDTVSTAWALKFTAANVFLHPNFLLYYEQRHVEKGYEPFVTLNWTLDYNIKRRNWAIAYYQSQTIKYTRIPATRRFVLCLS